MPVDLSRELKELCAEPVEIPLAISTLRGQFADNREWSADPSRPAVIVGTVDMIGSRLLFSGYGIGFKSKPLHAGFLGQDVLLVHDEAHLEPAFQQLLVAIECEQRGGRLDDRYTSTDQETRASDLRSIKVMELSATSRGGEVFGLTDEDRSNPEVKKRIDARKAVHLHECGDEKKLHHQLAELALQHKGSKRTVLVFARTVETVEKIAAELRKAEQQVETLTGTLRGKERDELVNTPTFCRFLPKAEISDETVYLVCTSAGEVGVNISADHLVCDLSTYESTAQRFGRVNRFGDRDDTRIDVVHPKEFDESDDYGSRLKKTLALLRKLSGDGSPGALDQLAPADRLAAFSPLPTMLSTSDILFDAWALTTVRDMLPGRPPVEAYLHGIEDEKQTESYIAWREEVWQLRNVELTDEQRAEVLDDYPLKPHELLRDSTYRRNSGVRDKLAQHAEQGADLPVWVQKPDGVVFKSSLAEVSGLSLDSRTVILPPEAGGLVIDGDRSLGLFDGAAAYQPQHREFYDVADEWRDERGQRRRIRVWENDPDRDSKTEGMRLIREIEIKSNYEDEDSDASTARRWQWYVKPKSADDDGSTTSREAVTWDVHTKDVTDSTSRIVKALKLPNELRQAFELAARFHDHGKKRILWQKSIGNPCPPNWLAKSGEARFGQVIKPVDIGTDYRHEFGSLLDVETDSEFQQLSGELKQLVLHLIAAHHGRGRPHFPSEEVFDPEGSQTDANRVATEVPLRFAGLQRKYGRWGLAYLESLLRAADYAASASPSATVKGST